MTLPVPEGNFHTYSVTASLNAVDLLDKCDVLVCAGDYVNGIQAAAGAGMTSVLVPLRTGSYP